MIARLQAPCFVLALTDDSAFHYSTPDAAGRVLQEWMEEARESGDPKRIQRAERLVIVQNTQTCGVLTCDGCGAEFDNGEDDPGEHLEDAEDEREEISVAVEFGWTRGDGDEMHCPDCPPLPDSRPGAADVPLPLEMPHDQFVALVKTGLTSHDAWLQATATPELAARARAWLIQAKAEVEQDIGTRRQQMTAAVGGLALDHPTRKKAEAEFFDWRNKARAFRRLVERRLLEISDVVRQNDIERRNRNREINSELDQTSAALFRLAGAVEAAASGQVDLGEVDALLDQLTVPHGHNGDTRTVRQVLAARTAKASMKAAV